MNGKDIQKILFDAIDKYKNTGGSFQQNTIITEVRRIMDIKGDDIELEQAILTIWYDLFRKGHLSWGYNLTNSEPPFCHLTEKGKEFLKNYSSDPANPEGYLNLVKKFKINDIAFSYIQEAVNSYNNNCHKAAAVMVGCASESMILELRDTLVAKMTALGKSANSKLKSEQIKVVIDEIETTIRTNKAMVPKKLFEFFDSYWTALSAQIRISRNEAGHPNSIAPVTEDSVHSSLLIFPEILKLIGNLSDWINASYS